MQPHQEKVKMTIECTSEERAYIKILAAKAHLSLSELVLSYLSKDFPSENLNRETLSAIDELDNGGGTTYSSMDEFWTAMGVKPRAQH